MGEAVQVRRSPQAVACRKRGVEELGKPQTLLDVENLGSWYTALEARKGKPGHGTMLEPTLHGRPRTGKRSRKARWMRMGCLITHSTQRWGKPTTRGRT